MQPRLAKKIVQRVQSGTATRTSYRKDQVEAAFRVLGVPLTDDLLHPWNQVQVKMTSEEMQARQEANRLAREQRLAALEHRRQARENTRLEAQRKAQALAAARQAFKQAMEEDYHGQTDLNVTIAEHIQEGDEDVQDVRGQLQHAGILDDASFSPPEDDALEVSLDDLTVSDLRAKAKEKGLKGYSNLKKDELITLLTGA